MKANSDLIRKLQFQMDESQRYNFKDANRFDRELEELKHKKMVREGKFIFNLAFTIRASSSTSQRGGF